MDKLILHAHLLKTFYLEIVLAAEENSLRFRGPCALIHRHLMNMPPVSSAPQASLPRPSYLWPMPAHCRCKHPVGQLRHLLQVRVQRGRIGQDGCLPRGLFIGRHRLDIDDPKSSPGAASAAGEGLLGAGAHLHHA
jgi:hypothetical protein